jgi:FtsZ-interacting cell division protein YlmF
MDFPNPSRSAGNLVESIKDKLNFGSSRAADRDEYVEEDYAYDELGYDDGFDDYGEYGFDESYATNSYDDAYSDSYTTRDTYRTRSPKLVSLDDIQNTTSAYGVMTPGSSSDHGVPTSSSVPGYLSSTADTRFSSRSTSRITVASDQAERDYTEGFGFDRADTSYRDFVSPYQRQNVEKTAVMPSTGSTGLDGLFTPTDGTAQTASAANDHASSIGGRFSRKIEIFEPKNFEEAVNIVAMLKDGSVVILNLKYVNAGLSKRVLDFAFGVVAALDMQITYEAPQVFSITQSGKLTLVERDQLRLKHIL